MPLKSKNNLILKLFLRLLPAQILNLMSFTFVRLLGGIMIGRIFGEDALAAFGVIAPMLNIIAMSGSVITSGALLFSARSLCADDRHENTQTFTTAFTLSLLLGLLLTAVSWLFSGQLVRLLGATDALAADSVAYLRGISLGFIPMLLTPVLIAFLQMKGDSKNPLIASTLSMGLYFLFMILFLPVLQLPFFFAGLANSLSFLPTCLFLLLLYIKKGESIGISLYKCGTICLLGITQSAGSLFCIFKAIFMNRIASSVGGAAALATMAFMGNADSVTAALVSPAFFTVSTMLISSFYEERDRNTLDRVMKTGLGLGLVLSLGLNLINFSLAYPFALLFGATDPSSVAAAIRIFSFSTPPFILYMFVLKFYACQNRLTTVNLFSLFCNLAMPVVLLLGLVGIYGVTGVYLTYPVGEFISLFAVLLYVILYRKKCPRHLIDLACLPDDFGVEPDLTFSLKVSFDSDACAVSQQTVDFMKSHGVASGLAMKAGLCLEELATNIVEKGFARDRKKHTVDITVCLEGGIRLIVRDDCLPFDPHDRFTQVDPADPAKGIGIRLVMLLAKSVDYKSIYGLNVLTVLL